MPLPFIKGIKMIAHAVAIKTAFINEPPGSSRVSLKISSISRPISIASAIARMTLIFIFIVALMIDAIHRLAYPLEQKLEGIANGKCTKTSDDGYGI